MTLFLTPFLGPPPKTPLFRDPPSGTPPDPPLRREIGRGTLYNIYPVGEQNPPFLGGHPCRNSETGIHFFPGGAPFLTRKSWPLGGGSRGGSQNPDFGPKNRIFRPYFGGFFRFFLDRGTPPKTPPPPWIPQKWPFLAIFGPFWDPQKWLFFTPFWTPQKWLFLEPLKMGIFGICQKWVFLDP